MYEQYLKEKIQDLEEKVESLMYRLSMETAIDAEHEIRVIKLGTELDRYKKEAEAEIKILKEITEVIGDNIKRYEQEAEKIADICECMVHHSECIQDEDCPKICPNYKEVKTDE
jgi:DNA repair exonuclease SbcCD ATPase subunit